MIIRKRYLLLTIFLVAIIQILLYTNNTQKTSFRYLKWTLQEISIGKLISVSFFSGLFISTFLNNTNPNYKKNSYKTTGENFKPSNNEEELNNKDDTKSNIDIPPQRDIRDAQPTISVNYRVVKNMEEYDFKRDQNYPDSMYNEDDWDNEDNDW